VGVVAARRGSPIILTAAGDGDGLDRRRWLRSSS